MVEQLRAVLDTLIGPLVQADQGELFVARLDADVVHLHLRGRFSGCPGNALAIRNVIEPALRAVAPAVRIQVTAGEVVPRGSVPWQGEDPSRAHQQAG